SVAREREVRRSEAAAVNRHQLAGRDGAALKAGCVHDAAGSDGTGGRLSRDGVGRLRIGFQLQRDNAGGAADGRLDVVIAEKAAGAVDAVGAGGAAKVGP